MFVYALKFQMAVPQSSSERTSDQQPGLGTAPPILHMVQPNLHQGWGTNQTRKNEARDAPPNKKVNGTSKKTCKHRLVHNMRNLAHSATATIQRHRRKSARKNGGDPTCIKAWVQARPETATLLPTTKQWHKLEKPTSGQDPKSGTWRHPVGISFKSCEEQGGGGGDGERKA